MRRGGEESLWVKDPERILVAILIFDDQGFSNLLLFVGCFSFLCLSAILLPPLAAQKNYHSGEKT